MSLKYKNRVTGIVVSVRADKAMDGSWECLSKPVKAPSAKPKAPSKAELLAQAMELGLLVNAKMTVKELQDAIEADKQEDPDTDNDGEGSEDTDTDGDESDGSGDADGAIVTSQDY